MQREMGWATVRDRLISGELDFAHAPAGLVAAITLGEGCLSTPCVALIEVNRHGNGITLSRAAGLHWSRGNLLGWIEAMGRKMVVAVPSWVSSHAWLATRWLRGAGVDPSKHVQLVVVPPMQMVANLSAGHLDGFCVGEPWNSMAVRQKQGWVAALSSEIAPGHSEKVLMVTRERLERDPDKFERLSSALSDACQFCEAPANREGISRVVADAFGARFDEEIIRRSLIGPFDDGRSERKVDRLHWFTGSWMDLESERLTAEVEPQCRTWATLQGAPMARRLQALERCFSPGFRSQTQFT
jgi:ABC-type nitrate/sulfonate/bicarbonate transport system substrate-binding protein